VFDDPRKAGAWPTWISGLEALVSSRPLADAYMMVQDDAVFCRDLKGYLESALWPAGSTALCSPYCPAPYRKPKSGWHEENRGWSLVGAVCWVIPPDAARAMVADLGPVEARHRIDARVGRWARRAGRSVWYHTPSLVQHGGVGNSALGDKSTSPLRVAADFIGRESLPDFPPPSRVFRP
jgi:hypothetical protein